jgi:hypothetical protein
MSLRKPLIMTISSITCLGSFYLATNLFYASNLTKNVLELIFTQLPKNIPYLTQSTTRLGILATLLAYTLYNLWKGLPRNMMNIYYLNIILALPEIYTHSKFQWQYLILNIPTIPTSKSFTETLTVALIIVAGYMTLFFDSKFKLDSNTYETRGIDPEDITNIYSRQSITSVTISILSILTIIFLSFIIQEIVNNLRPIAALNNMNYVVFGILSSILISSTLFVYLTEYTRQTK